MDEKKDIRNLSLEELIDFCAANKLPKFRKK